MSYQQVGSKTLRQLNRDNAAQHGTHSGDAEPKIEIERIRSKIEMLQGKSTPGGHEHTVEITQLEKRIQEFEGAK